MIFPKPERAEKPRRRIKSIGRRGRANQQAARARRYKARAEGWLVCEIGPILRERGIDSNGCLGNITLCHSLKTDARRALPDDQRDAAENDVAGGCEFHHYLKLDTLAPRLTFEIVREAIARRG